MMDVMHCPGKDRDEKDLKPSDVFEVQCPGCGQTVEFWHEEPRRKCRSCGQTITNPHAAQNPR